MLLKLEKLCCRKATIAVKIRCTKPMYVAKKVLPQQSRKHVIVGQKCVHSDEKKWSENVIIVVKKMQL